MEKSTIQQIWTELDISRDQLLRNKKGNVTKKKEKMDIFIEETYGTGTGTETDDTCTEGTSTEGTSTEGTGTEEICYNCSGDNINNDSGERVCYDCGLVLSDEGNFYVNDNSNNIYELECSTIMYDKKKVYSKYGKLKQMQEWYKWTNDEKVIYKLTIYTEQFCKKLGVSEKIIPMIIETVIVIMSTIKENYGTKRARVKDGIIIMCIHLVSKNTDFHITYNEMAKKTGVDMKYITRADSLILELINAKKLNFQKDIKVQDVKTPYSYILEIINKNKLHISENLLKKIKTLIEICEDNDLLIDHSPQSIGACCFYYVLKASNDINIKLFSNISDLSIVTIMKTYNKLKVYSDELKKYGI